MEYNKDCGCGATKLLDVCPMHRAAPDMYKSLKYITEKELDWDTFYNQALKALAKAEGKDERKD